VATLRRPSARLGAALAAVLVAGAAAFVLVWFQPQKLFIDDRVDEALPAAAAATGPATAHDLSVAPFRSYEHATRGRARVLAVGARRYVRFEGFRTSNGPL
jgi:hypothetical protein